MKKQRTPLKGLKNFGPMTYAEFESMGILFLDQIKHLGFEGTCRQWVQYYPERLNANAFLGIACSLDGVVWTRATISHRQMAHRLVAELREEFNLPRVKRRQSRNR